MKLKLHFELRLLNEIFISFRRPRDKYKLSEDEIYLIEPVNGSLHYD